MMWGFPAQYTDHYDRDYNDQDGGDNRYNEI